MQHTFPAHTTALALGLLVASLGAPVSSARAQSAPETPPRLAADGEPLPPASVQPPEHPRERVESREATRIVGGVLLVTVWVGGIVLAVGGSAALGVGTRSPGVFGASDDVLVVLGMTLAGIGIGVLFSIMGGFLLGAQDEVVTDADPQLALALTPNGAMLGLAQRF
ncbi:MAG: hypothetical protein IT378_24495 [Sandaracinaceae bacterium]|nr:hypothetical protein [Sandaracinaceae bacterium]